MGEYNPKSPDDIIEAVLTDPVRRAKMDSYHAAMVAAMNVTHDEDGTQDMMGVFVAIGMLLGQTSANLPSPTMKAGVCELVCKVAAQSGPEFIAAGKASMHLREREKQNG